MGQTFTKSKEPLNPTDELIQNYVKELLKDKRINNLLIPDVLEEKLYEDILTTLIENLKKILSEAKIEFLDHEIHFLLVPKSKHV